MYRRLYDQLFGKSDKSDKETRLKKTEEWKKISAEAITTKQSLAVPESAIERERTKTHTSHLINKQKSLTLNSKCNKMVSILNNFLFPCPENKTYKTLNNIEQGDKREIWTTGIQNSSNSVSTITIKKFTTDNIFYGAYIQAFLNKKCKNIMKIHDVGIIDEGPSVYSIMEEFRFVLTTYDEKIQELMIRNDEKRTLYLKKIFYDIFLGLKCINGAGFVHRNLNADNVGITGSRYVTQGKIEAKIFDFDFIVHIDDVDGIKTDVGTRGFIDPDFVKSKQCNIKSDVYAAGVMLYKIFVNQGISIFRHTNINFLKIEVDRLNNTSYLKIEVEEKLKLLIEMCTNPIPTDRCTAEEALTSSWFDELKIEPAETYDDVDRRFTSRLIEAQAQKAEIKAQQARKSEEAEEIEAQQAHQSIIESLGGRIKKSRRQHSKNKKGLSKTKYTIKTRRTKK